MCSSASSEYSVSLQLEHVSLLVAPKFSEYMPTVQLEHASCASRQHNSSRPDLQCQYQPDTLCTKSLQRRWLRAKDISGTFPNGLRH